MVIAYYMHESILSTEKNQGYNHNGIILSALQYIVSRVYDSIKYTMNDKFHSACDVASTCMQQY